jgi:hypothetical protein
MKGAAEELHFLKKNEFGVATIFSDSFKNKLICSKTFENNKLPCPLV